MAAEVAVLLPSCEDVAQFFSPAPVCRRPRAADTPRPACPRSAPPPRPPPPPLRAARPGGRPRGPAAPAGGARGLARPILAGMPARVPLPPLAAVAHELRT